MTALLSRRPSLAVDPRSAGALRVERTDISFANVSARRIAIEVPIVNDGEDRSLSSGVLIQAAPLGAFVPWQPLAASIVPALEPGESHTVRLEVIAPPALALGQFDRVPPRRLLTALGAEDDPAQRQDSTAAPGQLSADIFRLLRQSNPHWAGNLNIFVQGKAVERHLARALRIYPGRVNMAMFVVGSGRDAYAFSLHGSGASWDATLHNCTTASRIALSDSTAVAMEQWIECIAMQLMLLEIRPPADCTGGEVEVHVRQRSTGKDAIVEFSLDRNAAGPGCFVV